ncbi:type II toxin-antitoxin system VapC family toxin [Synechocystis sp. PCC 7509]|uniref:type II toxin-antitoxin system VapC family toxin n=1 Tax=Synechocystis sp. PCC 7509 TaxID=927677 RepID=UPI0002AC0C04|nr:type II toxin-antitoxin system VapC family toxin [Synechocystis sp. PCC 7509]
MTVYFIDSSALVKRYISEIGSVWVLELFDPAFGNEVFIAAVSGVEIIAAIARRSRGGSISATDATKVFNQLKSDLQTEYQIIEITESIINDGMTLAQKHGLRGYDAIQLAAGCALNMLCITYNAAPIIFVSADKELNIAASIEGLVVENPNNHP